MIYQVFHRPELFASCDSRSPHNRPIGVGAAADWCRKNGTLHDAAGSDQINHLNQRLNEWTAIYWVWRHLSEIEDADRWIGFSHYRRPAPAFMPSEPETVNGLLSEYDVLSWVPNLSALEQQAAAAHPRMFPAIWTALETAFGRAVRNEAALFCGSPMLHPFANCFVLAKERFADYAVWCWRVLQPLIGAADRSPGLVDGFDLSQARNLAFLSERLLPIYCMVHRLKVGFFFEGHYSRLPQ